MYLILEKEIYLVCNSLIINISIFSINIKMPFTILIENPFKFRDEKYYINII